LVDELISNRHKALVFSQFVTHLELIRELLDKKGIRYQYLDGSTPAPKRSQAVNAFQAGDGDLFLISLKAGGSGLNLTAADYVIHMDPWWNPAVEDQASDRAHRMGQKRPVTIYRLVAKDTIEDKIIDLHRHKRDLANNLLEGGDLSGKMSVDEMLALIKDFDYTNKPINYRHWKNYNLLNCYLQIWIYPIQSVTKLGQMKHSKDGKLIKRVN
jgi:SNF2 family DNA or RNA helicase